MIMYQPKQLIYFHPRGGNELQQGFGKWTVAITVSIQRNLPVLGGIDHHRSLLRIYTRQSKFYRARRRSSRHLTKEWIVSASIKKHQSEALRTFNGIEDLIKGDSLEL